MLRNPFKHYRISVVFFFGSAIIIALLIGIVMLSERQRGWLCCIRNRLILTFVLLLGLSFNCFVCWCYWESANTIRSDNESAALEKISAYAVLFNTTITQIHDFSSIVYNHEGYKELGKSTVRWS